MTQPDSNKSQNQEFDKKSKLFLCNDDHNNFEYVIGCLIDICNFDEIQSEQLALLAHFNGKTIIKEGDFIYLSVLKQEFDQRGLTVELDP